MTAPNHTTETRVDTRRPAPAEIAARAFQIYQERGCQPGHEIDDWLQAEYELIQLPIRKLAQLKPTKAVTARRRSLVEIVRAALY